MRKPLRVLFLTDNFPPEVNAPASRTYEHCREWVRLGHRVTVVTTVPNFPKGAVFPGFRNKLWQVEEMGGIRVIRLWSYITANQGFLRRSLDYASFMVSATIAAPFVGRHDLVVATSPQFFSACAGYAVGCLKRVPFVFELRDLWPESIRAVGAMRQSRVLDALERLELFLYRKAAAIVSVTRSFRTNLAERGIDPAKVAVITNGVDLTRFGPRAKDGPLTVQLGLEGKFVAGYIGTHGLAHGLSTLLDAAEKLARDPQGQNIRLLFVGDGACKPGLVAEADRRGLANVVFVDTVPKEDVARYWSLLDASIVHLKDSPTFAGVIPSKIFEAMAMGLPVLLGVRGEAAGIIEAEETGLVFEPENPDALCSALMRLTTEPNLLARLKSRGPAAAIRYDRTFLARTMMTVLEKVANRQPIGTETPEIRHHDEHTR